MGKSRKVDYANTAPDRPRPAGRELVEGPEAPALVREGGAELVVLLRDALDARAPLRPELIPVRGEPSTEPPVDDIHRAVSRHRAVERPDIVPGRSHRQIARPVGLRR